jgi:hypothetical protein
MPAEMIRPYVPVSGPALGVEVAVLDAVADAPADGEANGLGEWDPPGDPPPQESIRRIADTRIAPRRTTGNCKPDGLYEASFLRPFGPGHAG